MTVTIANIKSVYQTNDAIQLGSQQFFIVDGNKLVSYYTTVGKLIYGVWHITPIKYSSTTTRQLNKFARNHVTINKEL
jgi:hypothetical protein